MSKQTEALCSVLGYEPKDFELMVPVRSQSLGHGSMLRMRWLEFDSPRLHFASRCERERTRVCFRWNRVVRPVVVALVRFQTDKDCMRRVSLLTLSGMLGLVACSSEPIAPPAPLNFIVVSAGGFKACGVAQGGAAYCWGGNPYGELGNGTTTSSTTPVAVSGGHTFTAISAGSGQACGVTSSGAAYCWGYNSYGGLGNGTTTMSTTPVAVSGGLTFTAVSTGGAQTCGVTASGAAYCWGFGGYGGLGNGDTTSSATPVAVSGGLTFAAVSAGAGGSNCLDAPGGGPVFGGGKPCRPRGGTRATVAAAPPGDGPCAACAEARSPA